MYFMLMCKCGQMEGARGLHQSHGAKSVAPRTGEVHRIGLGKSYRKHYRYLLYLPNEFANTVPDDICT